MKKIIYLRKQQHSIQNYMKNALLTLLCYLCCLQLFADEQTNYSQSKVWKTYHGRVDHDYLCARL